MVALAGCQVCREVDLLNGRASATAKPYPCVAFVLHLLALRSPSSFNLPGPRACFRINNLRGCPSVKGKHNLFRCNVPRMSQQSADLLREGIKYVRARRFNDATRLLEHALAITPNHHETLYYLGLSQEQLGRPMKAADYYQRALQVNPQGGLWAKLGILLLNTGRQDQAQKALSSAVAMLPSDPTLRAAHAGLLRGVGRFDESYRELIQAAQLALVSADGLLVTRANVDKTCLAFAPPTLVDSVRSQTVQFAATADSQRTSGSGRVAACLGLSALPPSTPQEWVERLRRVHVTHAATEAQCEWAIDTAERHAAAIGGWDGRGHHHQHRTNNIVVADNKELTKWVQGLLLDRIWPAIKLQFGIDADDLWLEDCFLVKYEASGQAGLGRHFDSCELSFNLLLSDPGSFQGGGTAFFDAEQEVMLHPKRGEVLTHYALLYHEGKPIVSGAPRYILAGFVRVQPLAKRWKELKPRARLQ